MAYQGSALPRVRYVYLVQDQSDLLRMGGTPLNVYKTAQTAYDAANALQLALDVSSPATAPNKVVIEIGAVQESVVGGILLTSNYNQNVELNGISGNISTTNILSQISFIDGRVAGSNGLNITVHMRNVSIAGNIISTSNSGGNGGNITIFADNANAASVNASSLLTGNGSGGTIRINASGSTLLSEGIFQCSTISSNGFGTGSGGSLLLGNVITSGNISVNGGASGNSGDITVFGTLCNISGIVTTNNAAGTVSGVTISKGATVNAITQNNTSTATFLSDNLTDCSITNFTRTNTGGGSFNVQNLQDVRWNGTFLNNFSITGATTIDPSTAGIVKGIVSQSVVLTSANPTETINTITTAKMPNYWPVRFFAASGLTVTFTNSGTLVCQSTLNTVLNGTANAVINGTNGDWVEFTKINGVIYQTNCAKY